ncbi:hypothetical protein BA896_001665 [Janthinobacterium lividum]|uniref:Uncharacterized protein n=1 Tax=Janthinobacterium lividum TaxID=29581 RepID=A0A1E8PNV3_9BURK|nr:hypothetical protein BA896_001665 [Janthinobacterium lividum]
MSASRRAGRVCSLLLAVLAGGGAFAAVPPVALVRADAGLHAARVPPNLLLNLSLTHAAAAAAHGGDYAPQREYAGYFHARMCYGYPYRIKDGAMLPDLRVATAYFSALKPADALHGCGGDSFSGNFLNWASASMLDIVRYALTGGDRVIDEVRKTVLQRAYLPNADGPIDFFAHPLFFPRKVLQEGVAAATPFALARLAIVSCRNRLLFSDASLGQPVGGSCDAPGSAATHGVFLARVRVCDADEGPLRDDLCLAYGKNYKPVGAVQRHGGRVRVGVFGHLNGLPASLGPVYGGVLRAPLAHVGPQRWTAPDFLPQDNPDAEWNRVNGVYVAQAAKSGGAVGAYINGLGRSNAERPGAYASAAPLAELLYESLRYLQGRQASAVLPPATVPPAIDDGLPVVTVWRDPRSVSCQRHSVVSLGDAGMAGDRYVPGNMRRRPRQTATARAPPMALRRRRSMRWPGRMRSVAWKVALRKVILHHGPSWQHWNCWPTECAAPATMRRAWPTGRMCRHCALAPRTTAWPASITMRATCARATRRACPMLLPYFWRPNMAVFSIRTATLTPTVARRAMRWRSGAWMAAGPPITCRAVIRPP